MRVGFSLLHLPGQSAISGRDHRSECARGPASQPVLRGEGDSEQMICRPSWSAQPFVAAVRCRQDDAACAGNYRACPVVNIETIKRGCSRRDLRVPGKTAVACMQDRAIAADGPTVRLIRGELD